MRLPGSGDRFFATNLLFKGGTCLIKSYFGYMRFSEDIDFTWKDQTVFNGMSQKAIRAHLSRVIDSLGEIFEKIAEKRDMDFKCIKSSADYIGAPSKAQIRQLVQIQHEERLASTSELNPTPGLVTGRCDAGGKGYQAAIY
jgi:hypothetical protein